MPLLTRYAGILGSGRAGTSRPIALAFLLCLSVAAVAVCGKDSPTTPATPTPTPTPPQPTPARPTTIDITPATVAPMTRIGQTVQLSATVKDQNNNEITGVSVTWKSGNPRVATVSTAGLVTAAGNGTTAITASTGTVTGTVRVTVSGLPVTPASIVITPAEPDTLTAVGQTVQLSATVKDQNNNEITGVSVTWSSNETRVATVSETGLVTAVDHGLAVINASAGTVTGTVLINVATIIGTPAFIVITPAEPDTLTDERPTVQLTATVTDEDGNTVTGVNVAWVSSNSLVAAVDDTGLVTAVGTGTAWIGVQWRSFQVESVKVTAWITDERGILTLLYYLTGGPNWSDNTNWLSEEPLRDWYGIETDDEGRVSEIRLDANNLKGSIPPELVRLAKLTDLDLRNNAGLYGLLPVEFVGLRLGTLHLDGTGVCAPPDPELQAWLRTIPNRQVSDCGGEAPSRSAAYLVQATQSFSHPVPLVAGERALLRVFVVAEPGVRADQPPVRATFYVDDTEVHEVDIPGLNWSLGSQIDESLLTNSVNAVVPGHVIMPGLEMVIEIDPDDTLASTPGIGGRLPETGRLAVDVREVPPLDLTLVPFLWEENPDRSVLTRTEGLTAESDLFRLTRDLLPVREFKLTVRDAVEISYDPVFENVGVVMRALSMVRAMDGTTGHYMGILRSYGGVADRRGFRSAAHLDEVTMAHELGHNMNLGHAPCGGVQLGLEEYYPHPHGSVGSWGYDFLSGEIVNKNRPDLMGYCQNPWIGVFSFSRAMNYRYYQEALPAPAAYSARSLLVWGGLDEHGDLFLEPAFLVDAPASPLQASGPYRLEGEDAAGAGLFSLSFEMPEIEGDGYEGGGAFAFVLPVRSDWGRKLDRVTISGPEGVAELDRDGDHASALLIDSVTGRVRGYLEDWPVPGDSGSANARRVLPEPGLDILISRGLPGPQPRER